jgi:hypothetical protein
LFLILSNHDVVVEKGGGVLQGEGLHFCSIGLMQQSPLIPPPLLFYVPTVYEMTMESYFRRNCFDWSVFPLSLSHFISVNESSKWHVNVTAWRLIDSPYFYFFTFLMKQYNRVFSASNKNWNNFLLHTFLFFLLFLMKTPLFKL